MGETTLATKGDTQATAQTSQGQDGNTSPQVPETYTREQVQKLLSDSRAEQGRKHKAELDLIIRERESFKVKAEGNISELESNKAEVEKLQAKFDNLASGDPEKFDVAKELKAVREERRQLQAEKRTLELEKQTHGERIKKAERFETEILIQGIAEGYENADAGRLTELCSTLDITTEERIRKVADTLWSPKGQEPSMPEFPPMKADSGKTSGGSTNLGSLPPRERVKEADRILRL